MRLFDPQHRIAREQGALAGPAEQLHQYRAQPVGRDRRNGNDVEQQARRVLAGDRGGLPFAPRRARVGAEIALIILPRRFLPLGVALDVEIGEGVEGQFRRCGAQRLAVVARLLLRIGPGADPVAEALGGGAGLDEGEGGIATQGDAAEGGSAMRAGSETSRSGRRTSSRENTAPRFCRPRVRGCLSWAGRRCGPGRRLGSRWARFAPWVQPWVQKRAARIQRETRGPSWVHGGFKKVDTACNFLNPRETRLIEKPRFFNGFETGRD